MSIAGVGRTSKARPARRWQAELRSLPIGVVAGALILLTPGHPWSIAAFSPEVWGGWGALLVGVDFTVICIIAWRIAEAARRLASNGVVSVKGGGVWDRDLDG